jgi:hypothetical protein
VAGRVVKALRCLSFGSKPFVCRWSAWTAGSSPAVTRQEGVRRLRVTLGKCLDREKARPGYNALAENVSHPATCPRLKPVENQRLRCADVPWVKESGMA